MDLVKKMLVFALVALTMVACQKDEIPSTENTRQNNVITTENPIENPTLRKRSCSSHDHMEKLLQDETFKKAYELRQRNFQTRMRTNVAESRAACSNPVVLPVAVHFQGVNADKACLVALAKIQIDILNADYKGTNGDIAQWRNNASSSFPGLTNGEACIEFCIASKNHPSGYNLNDGDLAVTVNQTNGDQSNDWSGYLNIFVNDADGALGYSPLGGSGNGDGVVILREAFGAGNGCTGVSPESPYDLGRTLTHEMGHYLNLDHIWGNGCGSDDGIADTPDQNSDNSGCPNIGKTSCGSADLHMNYMDYTNDACMYMFTAGQSNVMENWMNSGLANRLKSSEQVCGVVSGDGSGSGGGDNGGGDNGGGTSDECTAPTTSSVTQINDTDVTIDWEDISGAIRYQIQYRPQGGGWTRKSGTASQKRINDLVPGTTYEYRMRTKCADNTWTSYSSISSYTLPGGDNGGGDNGGGDTGTTSRVQIKVTLDDFGSETDFAIEDASGNIVKSWGPFADGQNGKVITKNIDLPRGVYTFVIFDAYADGICCDYGDGQWTILVDGSQIASSDGIFGAWEEFDFGIGGARLSGPASRKDPKNFNKAPKKKKFALQQND